MKKLILTTVLALTVLASNSYATNDELFIRVNKDAKTFSLHQNSPGLVKLKIRDDKNTLYSKSVNTKKAYVKSFDLTKVSEGTYSISVEDVQKIRTYEITVFSDSLIVNKVESAVIFKPSVTLNERSLDISMLSLGGQGASINIYDNQGQIIHSNIAEGQQINRRFDLSQLENGAYTVICSMGEEVFSSFIVLK